MRRGGDASGKIGGDETRYAVDEHKVDGDLIVSNADLFFSVAGEDKVSIDLMSSNFREDKVNDDSNFSKFGEDEVNPDLMFSTVAPAKIAVDLLLSNGGVERVIADLIYIDRAVGPGAVYFDRAPRGS